MCSSVKYNKDRSPETIELRLDITPSSMCHCDEELILFSNPFDSSINLYNFRDEVQGEEKIFSRIFQRCR